MCVFVMRRIISIYIYKKKSNMSLTFDGCAKYGKGYSLDTLDNCTHTAVDLGNAGQFCCPAIKMDGCAQYGKGYSLDNCTDSGGFAVDLGNEGRYCCPKPK